VIHKTQYLYVKWWIMGIETHRGFGHDDGFLYPPCQAQNPSQPHIAVRVIRIERDSPLSLSDGLIVLVFILIDYT
jgi:hypothetical protein